jgi:prophage DNA circulation protein
MTYDVVKMEDNTYQTSAVTSQLVVMSNRISQPLFCHTHLRGAHVRTNALAGF